MFPKYYLGEDVMLSQSYEKSKSAQLFVNIKITLELICAYLSFYSVLPL
ncbi:hypothetical protein SAMN05421640_1481 [Ekhidna lutea]|uniref:Uncharacterized protein n=1 Tax=Ekhidna lutea TaxID=447679 RepID=A0A239HSI7_EKHLU|nr:hypothetical protein SAMN05421640_1481 [Ekhidna lutea]